MSARDMLNTNLDLLKRFTGGDPIVGISPAELKFISRNPDFFRTVNPPKKKCYLIGSLRNEYVPTLSSHLRQKLPEVEIFDDWYAAGPRADDHWKEYEQDRQRPYVDALQGYAARHVFDFDKHHLDTCTHALLILPAGKSGHMEIMYAAYGVGAKTAILLEDGADPRWDVMYQFIPNILGSEEEVVEWLNT